jgi:predicted dehydrogenase
VTDDENQLATANVAIVGCGDILQAYMSGLRRFGSNLRVLRCADVLLDRAEAAAERYGISRWGHLDDVFVDDDVDVVVSLTPPVVHHEIIAAAASGGKHVFTEKPLATTTALAAKALELAKDRGVRVGCAPDTFLGSAAQTARAAIDAGAIGEPIGCTAFSPYSRAERRHPNPRFLFAQGAGPLMDTAPYFVSALINLLGSVTSVSGLARMGAPVRRVARADGSVQTIEVTVPTHVTALLRFGSSAVGTLVASYDIWDHDLPAIEIYGTEGMLSLPHPNWADGDVTLKLHDEERRTLLPVIPMVQAEAREKVRGLGVVDLVASLNGAPHRSDGRLGYHTLEIIEAMQRSSDDGQWVEIESEVPRPDPVLRSYATNGTAGVAAPHSRPLDTT